MIVDYILDWAKAIYVKEKQTKEFTFVCLYYLMFIDVKRLLPALFFANKLRTEAFTTATVTAIIPDMKRVFTPSFINPLISLLTKQSIER